MCLELSVSLVPANEFIPPVLVAWCHEVAQVIHFSSDESGWPQQSLYSHRGLTVMGRSPSALCHPWVGMVRWGSLAQWLFSIIFCC